MKRELFALANKNRSKMKYRTAKLPLQKDFITANTVIKDKTIKSKEETSNSKGYLSPLINTGKEIVIKNTSPEDKYFNNNKTHTNKSESIILSGSNYNKMIPEVGVVVKQDNQSKDGGLNFHNQFGKMSVKEYEQLRAMYMNNNNSHTSHTTHIHSNYSSNMLPQNRVIVNDEISNEYNKSNITNQYQSNNSYTSKYLIKRARTDDIMVNSGNIALYNWNDQPNNYNTSSNGILNEDLFKGRKINQLKTNPKRNSVPQNLYNYSLPINFNYYNSNSTTNNNNNFSSSIPLRKISPSNNRTRRKF